MKIRHSNYYVTVLPGIVIGNQLAMKMPWVKKCSWSVWMVWPSASCKQVAISISSFDKLDIRKVEGGLLVTDKRYVPNL